MHKFQISSTTFTSISFQVQNDLKSRSYVDFTKWKYINKCLACIVVYLLVFHKERYLTVSNSLRYSTLNLNKQSRWSNSLPEYVLVSRLCISILKIVDTAKTENRLVCHRYGQPNSNMQSQSSIIYIVKISRLRKADIRRKFVKYKPCRFLI